MSLLDLLVAEDVETFNKTRGERQRVELFASDLAEKDLQGVDLSGADADKSDLTGADLSGANLFRTQLSGIDGGGMKLVGAVALRALMREAWLEEADLTGFDATKADLSEANLSKTKGEKLRAPGARMREVDAHEAHWPECDLSEAGLHKANFEGATLTRSVLAEVRGGEANFTSAKLDFIHATGANFSGANFSGANLTGSRLDSAILTNANFEGADLSQASLRGANLTGANFSGATLRGAVLAEAVLDGVDLSGLDLQGVDLTGLDPDVIGLDAEQRAAVAAVGVPVIKDAHISYSEVSAARHGARVAVLWENEDAEEAHSLRFVVAGEGSQRKGIVPVIAEAVRFRAVVPVADGFEVLVLAERAGQTRLSRFPLGLDGKLGAPDVVNPGYEPGVLPVVRRQAGRTTMYGLAKTGPTLVVHAHVELPAQDDEPAKATLSRISASAATTARGFLSKHDAVLASKGGTVIPCGPSGPGKPVRPPEGFPGTKGMAVDSQDGVVTVWVEPQAGRQPGGLRYALLPERGNPEIEVLTKLASVLSLDVLARGGKVYIAWVDAQGGGLGETKAHIATLPDQTVKTLTVADVDEVAWAPDAEDGAPALTCTTIDGALVIVDVNGKSIARLAPGPL